MPGPNAETADWRESIPEDLRDDPTLADIQDVGSLVKGYVHAQRMVGGDRINIPATDANEETWNAYYDKLGRPSGADKYETPTENMPEGVTLEDDLVKSFHEEAYRMGLSNKQTAALIRWQSGLVGAGMADAEQKMGADIEQATATMKTEFGTAYEQNMRMSQDAVRQFGGDELIDVLNTTGLGNDPAVIKAFYSVARAISQDEIRGGGGNQSFLRSPSEAKALIAEKRLDKDFMAAYLDKSHVGHSDAMKEMGKLHEVAHPEQ